MTKYHNFQTQIERPIDVQITFVEIKDAETLYGHCIFGIKDNTIYELVLESPDVIDPNDDLYFLVNLDTGTSYTFEDFDKVYKIDIY